MIFLSRGAGSWKADKLAISDFRLYANTYDCKIDDLPLSMSKFEAEMLYYSAFNTLIKHYRPATSRAKIAPVAKAFISKPNSGWTLLPQFFDGLNIFCGSDSDDRLPLFLELLPFFHRTLNINNIIDNAFIVSNVCAEFQMWRRGEYAVQDAFSMKDPAKLTFAEISIASVDRDFSRMNSEQIASLINWGHKLWKDSYQLALKVIPFIRFFLRRSKTDIFNKGVFTLCPSVKEKTFNGVAMLFLHWFLRLTDGEVFTAESPVFGVRIYRNTVPLDYKFLKAFDKKCAESMCIKAAYRIKGHSRRKGFASSMCAAGIKIGEVRTCGRWSNGVITVYIRMPDSRKIELLRKTSENAAANLRALILPEPINF